MAANEQRIGDDLLLEEARRREDILHGAASVIDTKASQIFAAAAFLAVQPAVVLISLPSSPPHPHIQQGILVAQAIACLPLFLSVCFAHRALRVESYAAPTAEDSWRNQVFESVDDGEGSLTEESKRLRLTWALLISTRERCQSIADINTRRLRELDSSRLSLYAAMILNGSTLAALALIRFF